MIEVFCLGFVDQVRQGKRAKNGFKSEALTVIIVFIQAKIEHFALLNKD